MKTVSIITLTTFLQVALANPEWATNPPTLDPKLPIYLASVFFPPEMHFLAWAPPHDPALLHEQEQLSWCREAMEVTDNMSQGARTPTFTFEGMDGLKVHDYFTDQAYISRHGTKFANCFVGPQSGDIGFCDGRSQHRDNKFVGKGIRTWSCYVIMDVGREHVFEPRVEEAENVTREVNEEESAKETGARAGGEERVAFTATVTGSHDSM